MSLFADYTRSTAFSISLSNKMVETLLTRVAMQRASAIEADLATRYDWYQPSPNVLASFGKLDDFTRHLGRTDQALIRRGLLEVVEVIGPCKRLALGTLEYVTEPGRLGWTIETTDPGVTLATLLQQAGFAPERSVDDFVKQVHVHPDDRIPITLRDPEPPTPRDRRLDLMQPGDEPYLSMLRRERVAL